MTLGSLAPALATYTRLPETAMLTGSLPPEDTGAPTGCGTPSKPSRSTEIWLLAASTASR